MTYKIFWREIDLQETVNLDNNIKHSLSIYDDMEVVKYKFFIISEITSKRTFLTKLNNFLQKFSPLGNSNNSYSMTFEFKLHIFFQKHVFILKCTYLYHCVLFNTLFNNTRRRIHSCYRETEQTHNN